jgi:MFS family permease
MSASNPTYSSALIKRAKGACVIAFILNGFTLGSLIARIPDLKFTLNLSNSQVGLSLLFVAVGVFLALKPAGMLCAKYGSRPIILLGTLFIALAVTAVAFSSSLWTLRLSLFLIGYCTATHDIGMNAHAVTLEKYSGTRLMGFLHANFSIGTFCGAILGGVFSQFEVSVFKQESILALLVLFSILILWNQYLPANSDIHLNERLDKKNHRSPIIFWILGFLGMSAAMGEGAAGDWGGVLARESFNASPFISTIPYIAYCATMVIGRLSCDRLANRFGASNVISAGGFVSGFGMLIGLLVGQVAGVIFGWFCVGLGLSIVMPLVFSAAGELAHSNYPGQIAPSVAVARVSGTAYFGFMVGPPVIGFLSELVTLRWAMSLVVLLSCVLLFGGKYARTD